MAVLHLAFALGIVPLIFAAMSHFIPVLTRTGDPGRWIARLPLMAQIAGLVTVAAMDARLPRGFLHLAAAVDFVLALVLLRWMITRAKGCIGSPHPGWRWYGMALLCLMLALLVVPPLSVIAELYAPLRLLHLHLNTLGLVGLAALGTLPVLLPTTLGKTDPLSAIWLRQRLMLSFISVLLVAFGAALSSQTNWSWLLSSSGGVGLLLVLISLLRQWKQSFALPVILSKGAGVSLLAATLGLSLVLLAGLAHGAGFLPAYPSIQIWASAFLLPLVTGALSQLLPVWRWPGPTRPEHECMRQKMTATAAWRGVFFVMAGLALLAGQKQLAAAFVVTAMGLFLIGLIQAVCVSRSTR